MTGLNGVPKIGTDRLRVEHPDCEHDFPPEMREMTYALFEEHLVPQGARAVDGKAAARL